MQREGEEDGKWYSLEDLNCSSGKSILFDYDWEKQKREAIAFYHAHKMEIERDYKKGQYIGLNNFGVVTHGWDEWKVSALMDKDNDTIGCGLVVRYGTKDPPLFPPRKVRKSATQIFGIEKK